MLSNMRGGETPAMGRQTSTMTERWREAGEQKHMALFSLYQLWVVDDKIHFSNNLQMPLKEEDLQTYV